MYARNRCWVAIIFCKCAKTKTLETQSRFPFCSISYKEVSFFVRCQTALRFMKHRETKDTPGQVLGTTGSICARDNAAAAPLHSS